MKVTWIVLLLGSLLGCSAAPPVPTDVSPGGSATVSGDDAKSGPAQSTSDGITFVQKPQSSTICFPLFLLSICIENTVDVKKKSLTVELTVNGISLVKKDILNARVCHSTQTTGGMEVCLEVYHTEGTWDPIDLNNCFKVTVGLILMDLGCYQLKSTGIQLNKKYKVPHGNLFLLGSSGDNSQIPHVDVFIAESFFEKIPGGANLKRMYNMYNMFSGGVPGGGMLSSFFSMPGAATTAATEAEKRAGTDANSATTAASNTAGTVASSASTVASIANGWIPNMPSLRWSAAPKTIQEQQT